MTRIVDGLLRAINYTENLLLYSLEAGLWIF